MRNTLALLTALCVGSVFAGCNSNSEKNTSPVGPPAQDSGLNSKWELKLQSQCPEAVNHENCVGEFGFAVMPDGTYQMGPGPKNEIRTGSLNAEELASVNQALSTMLAGVSASEEKHESITAGESDDTVTFTRANTQAVLLKTAGADFYFQNVSSEEAKSIHQIIRKLALKYYALPFPDSCLDGAPLVQKLLSSAQSCATDSDCIYLDATLNPIANQSSEYVITDDCSVLRPLAVGNLSSVKKQADQILESIQELRTNCADRWMRADCTQQLGFQPNNRAPVCALGVCQAPAGAVQ
ncbi:MAG: hypothetical protein ACO3A2_05890 [Bdellovibrionia bacterium]